MWNAQRFRILRRLACAGAALFFLAGCGPAFETYRYISLEGYPDARVVQHAQATPGKHRFFVGEIPVRYEIERDGYTLVLEIDPRQWGPTIDLSVRPYPEYRIGFPSDAERRPGPCVEWVTSDRIPGRWLYRFRHCGDSAPWEGLDKHLRFQVLDADGNVVADEDAPYTIKRDGFFVYTDAV